MARNLSSVFRGGGGLSEKTIKERSGGGGSRDPYIVIFKDGEPLLIQFWGVPRDKEHFREFEQHTRQVGRSWEFVPCIGDGCLACEDEDERFANPNYAFAAQVWSFKDKKPMILSGGTSLAQRVVFKYKQGPTKFAKKVWSVTRLATSPKSFDFDTSEERPLNLANKEPVDIADYLAGRYELWAKTHSVSNSKSTLDEDDEDIEEDDDDEIEEEEIPTRKQMMQMDWADLKAYAKSISVPDYRDYKKRSELIDAIEETLENE